jgi:hypothetical protein
MTGQEIYKEADRYFEESVCPERKSALQITMQKLIESGDQSFVARLLSFGPRIWYDANCWNAIHFLIVWLFAPPTSPQSSSCIICIMENKGQQESLAIFQQIEPESMTQQPQLTPNHDDEQ